MLFSMNAILGVMLSGPASNGASAATPAIAFFGAYYKLQNFLYMPIPLGGTILFEAIPRQLLSIFSSSEAALAIGVPGLRVIAATFALGSATTVLGYTCSGLGNGLTNMVGTALRQFFLMIPLAYLFGRLGGVGAVRYAMWVSEALAVLFSILCTRREFRQKVDTLSSDAP